MRKRAALLLVAASLAVPMAGQATHSTTPTATSSGCQYSQVTTIGNGAAAIYIDNRPSGPPVPGIAGGNGTWGYAETNGRSGLQVGGAHQVLMILVGDEDTVRTLGEVDPCDNFHTGPSDQMIF